MTILVCGSRSLPRSWYQKVKSRLEVLPRDTCVVQGGADGADMLARVAAQWLGLQVVTVPADWKQLGRAAGPIRNQRMLDEHQPELVIAFHTDPALGRGTADMVRRARAAGLPVEIHT